MDCLFIKIEKFLKKLQIPKNEAHVSTQIVCSARFLQKSPLLGRRRWLSAAIQANHRWFRCSPRASSFPPKRALGFSRELRWLFCSFSTKHASRADKVAKMKPFLLVLVVTMVQALDHCSHKLDNHYWSTELKSCLPCTNCHDQRLITIIGCAPDKDTICGTIEDLR